MGIGGGGGRSVRGRGRGTEAGYGSSDRQASKVSAAGARTMRLTNARGGLVDIGLTIVKVLLQRVDAAVPELFIRADPRVRRGEWFRPERQPMVAAAYPPTYQPCLLEDLDVFRDGIERHSEGSRKVGHLELAFGERPYTPSSAGTSTIRLNIGRVRLSTS